MIGGALKRSGTSGGQSMICAGLACLALGLTIGGCAMLSAFDPEKPQPAAPHPTAPMTRPQPIPAGDAPLPSSGSPTAPTPPSSPAASSTPASPSPAPAMSPSTMTPIPDDIDAKTRERLASMDAQLSALRGALELAKGAQPIGLAAAPFTGGVSEYALAGLVALITSALAALKAKRESELRYAIQQIHNTSTDGAAAMTNDPTAKAIIARVTQE